MAKTTSVLMSVLGEEKVWIDGDFISPELPSRRYFTQQIWRDDGDIE